MFSPDMLQDEIDCTGLNVWGIIIPEDSNIDCDRFRRDLGVKEWNVGVLQKSPPEQLICGSDWTSSGYLSFGDIEARRTK